MSSMPELQIVVACAYRTKFRVVSDLVLELTEPKSIEIIWILVNLVVHMNWPHCRRKAGPFRDGSTV